MPERTYQSIDEEFVTRCQSALQREWARSMSGYPWQLSRDAIENYLLHEQLGLSYPLPVEWQKLLFLAHAPSNVIDTLSEEDRFSQTDYDNLIAVTNALGFNTPRHTPTDVEETEEEPDEKPSLTLVKGGLYGLAVASAAAAIFIAFWIGTRRSPGILTEQIATLTAEKATQTQLLANLVEKHSKAVQDLNEANQKLSAQIAHRQDLEKKLIVANSGKEDIQKRIETASEMIEQLQKSIEVMKSSDRSSITGLNRPPSSIFENQPKDASNESDLFKQQPVLSSVASNKPKLSWKYQTRYPITVSIYRGNEAIWTKTVSNGASSIEVDEPLKRGQMYTWVLSAEGLNPSRRAFYVLHADEFARYSVAIERAATPLQKASVFEKFGLYSDLFELGDPYTSMARIAILKLNRK